MDLTSKYRLYDRVIQFSIARNSGDASDPYKQITIGQLEGGGYKPAIDVSLTMLPNSVCLNMTVRVTNMVIAQDVDIRSYSVMSITIGYPGNTISFTGPVFSSYLEKPNPDGIVVFEGIVTGESGKNIFSARPYVLKFYQATTLKDFVEKICAGITDSMPRGKSLTADWSMCSPELLYHKIEFSNGEYFGENAFAVINWMQEIIYEWGQEQEWHYFSDPDENGQTEMYTAAWDRTRVLQAVMRGDKLFIIDSHCVPTATERRQAISLTAVKSASFSGPALTVSAPYNPKILPGVVFKMDPVYYKGGTGLPNVGMSTEVFNPDNGLYRVIKEDIQFATYGNTNNMTLLAVPASMYDGESASSMDEQLQTIQAQTQKVSSNLKSEAQAVEQTSEINIVWGNAPAEEEAKDMWSTNYDPENAANYRIGVNAETQEGFAGINTLSQLAQKIYGTELFYLANNELNEEFDRTSPKGVEMMYFFPLIMVATDKAMNKPNGKKTYWIDRKNPDMVRADYYVRAPSLNKDSAKQLIGNRAVATIFADIRDYYQKQGNIAYAGKFSDIYNYITKGKK